ncbi:ATP-binding protein [Quadrisphaera sp. GCM10027208]|uniref:sensor histidine kinase n=1 Tax=Quadrisphaera sp. GCM10027208 TaxID=3273423 RepID=UPI0036165B8A
MSHWRLHRRLLATLAVTAAVVLVLVAVALSAFASVRTHQREVVNHYYEAVTSANDLYVSLVRIETAVRGYALTGDPQALEPARDAQSVLGGGDADRLQELLAEDPESLAALEQATAAAAAWWNGWAQPVVEQVDVQGAGSVTDAQAEEGERLFAELQRTYGAYVDTLGERRQAALVVLEQRSSLLLATVVAVAVVGLLAFAVLGWLLRRWVTGPLEELAARTRAVAGGDLEHPVDVEGPPEVVALSHDVEGMRRELVGQIAAARAASRELEAAKGELEARTEDLERSNRELEQFAYVASHDLQEPLRKVASFTQMLQRRYGGELDERADQYIEFAVDGAKRMQQLINDLLQFSRVGRITGPQTDVDLDAVLGRVLRDLGERIDETGATVTSDPLPTVRGEQGLLGQVLANLVGNALKFHGDEPPRVHVGARRDGDEWVIEVSDNGIGIEPQYAERVFVLFQRLHPKDVYAGTGIGLALARKIVEHHGGTISIDTQRTGSGTSVRFTLPVPGAGPAADGHDPAVLGQDVPESHQTSDDTSVDPLPAAKGTE